MNETLLKNGHMQTLRNSMQKPCISPFGLFLRQAREKKGLSVREMEFEAGIPATTWNSYEARGFYPKTVEKAQRLASFLGISEDDVVTRIEMSRNFMNSSTNEEYEKFILDQRTAIQNKRSYRHFVARKNRINGKRQIAWVGYTGPHDTVHVNVPMPIRRALRAIAIDKECSVGDIVKLAIEEKSQRENWDVDWESENAK